MKSHGVVFHQMKWMTVAYVHALINADHRFTVPDIFWVVVALYSYIGISRSSIDTF